MLEPRRKKAQSRGTETHLKKTPGRSEVNPAAMQEQVFTEKSINI